MNKREILTKTEPSPDGFDYAAARRYLQKKQEASQARRLILWQQAQDDARKIIAMIIRRYAPQRIIQWGSVLAPAHFSEASDIDLAVAGVDTLAFFRLFADAEEMTQFPLDLVRWEDLHPAFQRILNMKGTVVYAAR